MEKYQNTNVKHTYEIHDKMTDFNATSLVIKCTWIIHTKEEDNGRMDKNYDLYAISKSHSPNSKYQDVKSKRMRKYLPNKY